MRPPTNPADLPDRACRTANPELFFPHGQDIAGARAVIRDYCAKCPVKAECLEWALWIEAGTGHSGRAGIYGAATPRTRARIWRERRAA